MKSRTVIILWVIALILGGAVFIVKKSAGGGSENATNRSPGENLIVDFPAEDTASIKIKGVEQSVTLVEKGGKWTVSDRDNFPANVRNIHDLLRTLSELKVTQGIEAGLSFAPRFGMDEDSSDPAKHGLTATFEDGSGKELATLSFGKNLDAASSSPYGGGSTGRYVRNHADESGFYAVSEVFGILSSDPKSWLADEFFRIEKIKTISLTQPGSDDNEWTLTRDDESADFKFTEAFPGVKVDTAAVTPLKSLFSYARFDDVVPVADVVKRSTPEKLQKAKITTFEGLAYDITLQPAKSVDAPNEADKKEAPPTSDNFLMTVSVTGEIPKERKKPENESKEDAEAADKGFKERIDALSERLEEVKKLQGLTFKVSMFTVDALLKDRAELMDKGPGPKGSATTPPSPGATVFSPPVQIPASPAVEEQSPPTTTAPEE